MASQQELIVAFEKVFKNQFTKNAGVEPLIDLDGRACALRATEDAVEFRFRLPVRTGVVLLDGLRISRARGSGTAAGQLIDAFQMEVSHAARMVRGHELLAIVQQNDWVVPDAATEEDLQHLERAATLLMDAVELRRKEVL